LAEVLAERDDVAIISDEIYDRLLYGGRTYKSFAATSPHAYERTLTFNSMSKSYSMTGWRIGYVAGTQDVIRNMGKLQSQTTSGAATFTMHAMAAALTGSQDCVEEMRSEFEQRAKVLHGRLNAIPGVVCPEPAGAFYVFPDVSATYSRLGVSGSVEWTTRLLGEAHLAVVPGAAFGLDNCVRLSFATGMEVIQKGLDRLERFLG
jgi:aspartate aminotransferase